MSEIIYGFQYGRGRVWDYRPKLVLLRITYHCFVLLSNID